MQFVTFCSDLIPSTSGFTGYSYMDGAFIASRGVAEITVIDGQDGAYVSWIVNGSTCTFGTDWNGLGRWFLYRTEVSDFWAISNSFILLLEEVAKRGHPLSIDPDLLKFWAYRGAFAEQIQSTETLVCEVSLISRWQNVRVDVNSPTGSILSFVARQPLFLTQKSYREELSAYLSLMNARIRSLLMSGVHLHFDLSGGLDSRVTFAFASRLIRENSSLKARIHVFSSPKESKSNDYKVASNIARDLGIEFSKERATRTGERYPESALRRWEFNQLGQYSLSSGINEAFFDPKSIRISGVGGESFRRFWHKYGASLQDLLDERRHILFNGPQIASLVAKISQSLEFAASFHSTDSDPLSILYREYRGRFHMGVPASNTVMLLPLAGRAIERLANAAPVGYFASRQMFFDIIYNLDPSLLTFAFDSQDKSPTSANLANLTDAVMNHEIAPIKIHWIKNDLSVRNSADETTRSFDHKEYCNFLVKAQKNLPAGFGTKAKPFKDNINHFVTHGKLPFQRDMQSLHYVHLASKVFSLIDDHPTQDDPTLVDSL